jgi:hypothetical protein
MSKPSPTRYRTTNWSNYTAALRKRGSLLIWLDKGMTWLAPPDGKPGRPAVFCDAAIGFCLTIKVLFKLPLGQTTGMVASLVQMAGLDWAVPDYTTLCRRQKTLAVQIPYRRADGPLNLLVNSTGIKFFGDGDGALSWFAGKPLPGNKWQARKHGVQGRRQWRKVDLAMDTATSDIRAVEFTPSSDGDGTVLPALLDQIPEGEEIGAVTAPSRDIASRCPAGQWTAPMTRAVATLPSSTGRPFQSYRSERTAGRGKRTARPQSSGTKPCAPPGTMAGRSGSAGPDTMQEAASRRNLSSFARKRLPVSGCAA